MNFYSKNAEQYSESTFNIEFAQAVFDGMEDFLNLNSLNKPILDIGCGSGRDALFLTNKGFSVHAFDKSPEMIQQAKSLTGLNEVFNIGSADDFESEHDYYFAYSIACLLHLNDDEFEAAIKHIFKHINFGGYFYFTVKKGAGYITDDKGRFFNLFNEEKINSIFLKLNLHVQDISETPDLFRKDTTWLNVLIQKPM